MSRRTNFLPAVAAVIALAWALVGWPPAGWSLSGEALNEEVHRISSQLRCPTCQAISVNDSEAAFSRQIREKVRRMVEEGQSEEAIKAFFVSRYGEWILRAPKKEGLGLVLWVLPVLALVVVGGLVFLRVLRAARSRAGGNSAAHGEKLTAAQLRRIEADLARFEEEG